LDNQFNSQSKLPPAASVIFILLLAALGFIAGGAAAYYLYLAFYPGTEPELNNAINNLKDHPEAKNVLFFAQAGATIGGLVLAPIVFLKTQDQPVLPYFSHNRIPLSMFVIAGCTVIVSFGLNSLFLKMNQEMVLPEFLKAFEEWARALEEKAAEQTQALTRMDSLADLMITLVVIAMLPAIGEEFVFRGLIQNELHLGSRNIHLSIWVAAIFFSAIHFQFFGFLPRMMLGALFGYLYYWSANLWVPIFAHFVNNAIQILALYYYQRGSFEFDLDKPESIPGSMVVISTVLTGGLLFYIYRYFKTYKPDTQPL